jgi:hypothetical protein
MAAALLLVNGLLGAGLQAVALTSGGSLRTSHSLVYDLQASPGGSLVLESATELFCLMMLFAVRYLRRKSLVMLLAPVAVALLGPCGALSLGFAWEAWSRGDDDEEEAESSSPNLTLACMVLCAGLLYVVLVALPHSCENQVPCVDDPDVDYLLRVCFLVAVAPLPLLLVRGFPPRADGIITCACMVAYLLMGAAGCVTHTRESWPEGDTVVKAVVDQSLVSPASRVVLVNFVHLVFSSVAFIAHAKHVRGVMGAMTLGLPFVGPAGAFGFFAALDCFIGLRKQGWFPSRAHHA